MNKICRCLSGVWIIGLLCLLLSIPVSAETPYITYTYDSYDQAVSTATAYEPSDVWCPSGESALDEPTDVYVTDAGEIFVLDSGHSRIVVLDSSLQPVRTVLPTLPDGQPLQFQKASGLFVTADGRILVADSTAGTVYILDAEGREIHQLDRPDSPLLEDSFHYQPIKVLEDGAGILYVLSDGCYNGALQFEKDYSFLGFFGREDVDVTPKVLLNYFWKQIVTDQQAAGLSRTVPVEMVSFCVDEKDFIFTIRKGNEVTSGQVRKLNARGSNVLEDKNFGDKISDIQLCDIAVDDSGYISIVDSKSGRIFQYDPEGTLLYAFGGIGTQDGTFAVPTAIETLGDDLLVLDRQNGSLTRFTPTAFARNVRTAVTSYRHGRYEEAREPWEEVLKADRCYEYANLGMGKIAERLGDYTAAMDYYYLGNDRTLYSGAFASSRDDWVRSAFPWILALVLVLGAVLVTVSKKRGHKVKVIYSGGRPAKKYPGYCLFHPVAGYEDLKQEKTGSLLLAGVILVLFLAVSIIARQVTGYVFNQNRPEEFNLLVMIASTWGLFALFVVCNWAVTTLMEGKGKLSEIVTFCSYALVPYILGTACLIVLSHVLSQDEAVFYTIAQWLVYGWTGFCLFVALLQVHQYTVKKTVGSILLTVAGMVICAVVVAIAYSVVTQLVSFLVTLVNEWSLK